MMAVPNCACPGFGNFFSTVLVLGLGLGLGICATSRLSADHNLSFFACAMSDSLVKSVSVVTAFIAELQVEESQVAADTQPVEPPINPSCSCKTCARKTMPIRRRRNFIEEDDNFCTLKLSDNDDDNDDDYFGDVVRPVNNV